MSDISHVIFACLNCKGEMTICAIWVDGTAKLSFVLQCENCGHEEVQRKSHRDLNHEYWKGE